jgi:solute carrier family 45 protein 1/2/4
MPKELTRLLIYHLIGWMALFSTEFFFTDFVAKVIYKGNPTAPKNSTEFLNFNQGTRIGSYGLVLFSVSTSFSASNFDN